jgi:hypothetical protein
MRILKLVVHLKISPRKVPQKKSVAKAKLQTETTKEEIVEILPFEKRLNEALEKKAREISEHQKTGQIQTRLIDLTEISFDKYELIK